MVDKSDVKSVEQQSDKATERQAERRKLLANLELDGRMAGQTGRVVRALMAKISETASLCEMQALARESQVSVMRLEDTIAERDGRIAELEGELAEIKAKLAGLKPKAAVDPA